MKYHSPEPRYHLSQSGYGGGGAAGGGVWRRGGGRGRGAALLLLSHPPTPPSTPLNTSSTQLGQQLPPHLPEHTLQSIHTSRSARLSQNLSQKSSPRSAVIWFAGLERWPWFRTREHRTLLTWASQLNIREIRPLVTASGDAMTKKSRSGEQLTLEIETWTQLVCKIALLCAENVECVTRIAVIKLLLMFRRAILCVGHVLAASGAALVDFSRRGLRGLRRLGGRGGGGGGSCSCLGWCCVLTRRASPIMQRAASWPPQAPTSECSPPQNRASSPGRRAKTAMLEPASR